MCSHYLTHILFQTSHMSSVFSWLVLPIIRFLSAATCRRCRMTIMSIFLCIQLSSSYSWALVSTASTASASPPIKTEAMALLRFIEGLHQTNASNQLKGWDAALAAQPCNWTGVMCNSRNDSIVGVHLSGQGLSGPLSSAAARAGLGRLSHLQSLELSSNHLSGPLNILDNLCSSDSSLAILDLSDNLLSGSIPPSITNCSSLTHLQLPKNSIEGPLQSHIGQLSRLQFLQLSNNYPGLTGPIPSSLSNCTQLRFLDLLNNSFSGAFPAQLSQLQYLNLSYNQLTGSLPASLLLNWTQLIVLAAGHNNLRGVIPPELGQLPTLQQIWIEDNFLSGVIPAALGNLSELQLLFPAGNNLTGSIPASLGQATQMTALIIARNDLTGEIPLELGNLTQLQKLKCGSNRLTGVIPPTMFTGMTNLQDIEFHQNFLAGEIPWGLGNCTQLTILNLRGNLYIGGQIPVSFAHLQHLSYLDLSGNQISGTIPDILSECSSLQTLSIGNNHLTGNFPHSVAANLSNLVFFLAAHNRLSGQIPPEIGGMQVLTSLDLSSNNFTGNIPGTLGNCVELVKLNLSENSLVGNILSELGLLESLTELDLSNNALSGSIPEFLSSMSQLLLLNVSNNLLEGPIPESGIFQRLNASSFWGNKGLCGSIIGIECGNHSGHRLSHIIIVVGSVTAAIIVLFLLGFAALNCYMRSGKATKRVNWFNMEPIKLGIPRLTAMEVWQMTGGFRQENMIGEGAFGMVYKGISAVDGTTVAVKLFKCSSSKDHEDDGEHSQRSFISELQSLAQARHRNLVRILGFCADAGRRALVLEMMPNGSLQEHLHGLHHLQEAPAARGAGTVITSSWEGSKAIIMGVTQALMYLHHECVQPIIHCDIKPQNILLDAHMEPRLTDFGLAKVFASYNPDSAAGISTSNVRGTLGYLAPELGNLGRITAKVDVYSFGILLLEMITHFSPVSDIFLESETLRGWVQKAMKTSKTSIVEVVSPILLASATESDIFEMKETLHQALLCCDKSPSNRPTMREVLRALEASYKRYSKFK